MSIIEELKALDGIVGNSIRVLSNPIRESTDWIKYPYPVNCWLRVLIPRSQVTFSR